MFTSGSLDYLFRSYTELKSVVLPTTKTTQTVSFNHTFSYCSSLESITNLDKFTNISNLGNAFQDCSMLNEVRLASILTKVGNAFIGAKAGIKVFLYPATGITNIDELPDSWKDYTTVDWIFGKNDKKVTFTWKGNTSEKSFSFCATKGENNVVVDWGNDTQTTYSGIGEDDITTSIIYGDTESHTVTVSTTEGTALTDLNCYQKSLEALDVTRSSKLVTLNCENNSLTALNVTNNTNLTSLSCSNNALTELDVSKNTKLTKLACSSNSLTALDVTNNLYLKELYCKNNQLSLDELYKAIKNGASYDVLFISPQSLPSDTVEVNIPITIPIFDGTESKITVTNGVEGTDYTYTDGVLTFLKAGTYTVTMTNSKVVDKKGIAEVSITYTVEGTPVDIEETNKNVLFSLYPNPVSDVLHIDAAGIQGIEVYNLQGVQVFSQAGNQRLVDMSCLPPGNYIVSIHTSVRSYRTIVIKK